jgi:hypothetical protein
VFALLGGPMLDFPATAAIAAELLCDGALAPLQAAGIVQVVTLAPDGISRR